MTNEANNDDNRIIILEGMSWTRALCAMRALMAPTKFYRVTHKRAREVLQQELGFCPKGKPGAAYDNVCTAQKGFRKGGQDAMLDWLGVVHIETHKEEGCVLPTDRTMLVVRP